MKYAGTALCLRCAQAEHPYCEGLWTTSDGKWWMGCSCEVCEANECASYDEEKPPRTPTARENFEASVNALFRGPF